MISQFGMAGTTQVVDRKAVEHELGWDVPSTFQYGNGSKALCTRRLREILWHQQSVLDEIKERCTVTFELGLLGYWSARRSQSNRDIIGTAPGQLSDYLGRV